MNELEQARAQIDDIDVQIARLFEARMDASAAVAHYKQEHGIPVLDAAREASVLEKRTKLVSDLDIRSYYVTVQQCIMDVSKQYQHRLLEGMSVAYSGVEGAFANIAAGRIFPDARLCPYVDFQAAYDAVLNGECDVAVLPVENSYAGEVSQVIDLMFSGPLYVNGVYTLHINQNLLGVKGASLADVKLVKSHPQALAQCAGFIRDNGFATQETVNTARAAAEVAAAGDVSVAAIASIETAKLYGLEVLASTINESALNTTKFAVFARTSNDAQNRDRGTFMMLFAVNNEAGALARAIGIIGRYGFNMHTLTSHPVKNKPWQYYFYVEAEGDERTSEGQEMLAELAQECAKLKIVGHYALEVDLEDKR